MQQNGHPGKSAQQHASLTKYPSWLSAPLYSALGQFAAERILNDQEWDDVVKLFARKRRTSAEVSRIEKSGTTLTIADDDAPPPAGAGEGSALVQQQTVTKNVVNAEMYKLAFDDAAALQRNIKKVQDEWGKLCPNHVITNIQVVKPSPMPAECVNSDQGLFTVYNPARC